MQEVNRALVDQPSVRRRIQKIMAANRGEIAVRIFRAAHELSLQTVAIYSHADRLQMHRYKAMESYEIGGGDDGPPPTPVGAYLDIARIVRIAKDSGCDAVHPGYGFLSENAEFARRVVANGMIFIGPSAEVIEMMGDKTAARRAAQECGVPCVPGTDGPVATLEEAREFVRQHGLPIIIKAAFGGGGRGMRVVRAPEALAEAFQRCTSEAMSAFGNGTVFIERYIEKPRHIEVQILADQQGNVVHMLERDCSVQRRHQKLVEVAPAHNLPDAVRQSLHADAVKLARHVGYRNAGTVEFLVSSDGKHYFIEVNPRIQVEHTVTEEITGIDLVAAQIQIAAGMSLAELHLTQTEIECRGVAMQCRVTTEDPANGFAPQTGRIDEYHTPAGPGIRLDGAMGFVGSVISPHYDSLLLKLTARARSYPDMIRKMVRALTEMKVGGVKTNIPFLQRLVTHPAFQSAQVHTSFIDETPELVAVTDDRSPLEKLVDYLGNVAVNGPDVQGMVGELGAQRPRLPAALLESDTNGGAPRMLAFGGWKQLLDSAGPEAFARAVRAHRGVLITDTTWRDAHQSLLMTRVRTYDLLAVASQTARVLANAFSLEMWGGATFDVALRFLHECPWKRLRQLRARVPNVPFQMLLRGANAVGYTSYPDNVVFEFAKAARENGIDVFRIFDSLNYVENLKIGMDSVRSAGGVVEAAICYTGDISDARKTKYTLAYYMDLTDRLVAYGTHILGIKDMAGLLKPQAATMLVGAIRARYPDLPIHVHTHDTAGTGVATVLAAAAAGADIVDVAIDAMSGLTSQPSMGAVVGALAGTEHDTGLALEQIQALNNYWEQVREYYRCFDPNIKSGSSDVYVHEMPGGQYTNLQFQSRALGLSDRWPEIKRAYALANRLLGDIVKVTPSSKVVGDLAQFLVQNGLNEEKFLASVSSLSLPTSVIEYFQGYLGEPPGGFPEPLRTQVLRGRRTIVGRPGASMPPLDLHKLHDELCAKYGDWVSPLDTLSAALYPDVFREYAQFYNTFGDISVLDTSMVLRRMNVGEEDYFDMDKGNRVFVTFTGVSQHTYTDGTRDVYFELNGRFYKVSVLDRKSTAAREVRAKAHPDARNEVGAPMAGVIVEVRAPVGHRVKEGDPIAVLNAMKMETVVVAPISGHVTKICVIVGDSLSAGDLIAVIGPGEAEPAPKPTPLPNL